MSLLCRIGWHDWWKWEEVRMTLEKMTLEKAGVALGLKRHCDRCGLVQVRQVIPIE